MDEGQLLDGKLEPTNEPYAVAKIAGVKMCEYYNKQYGTNFKSLMPCNTYGPNDNYDLQSSHFLPALIKKVYEAKDNNEKFIEIWGNGKTKREVIYVDDLADAVMYFLFKKSHNYLINIGTETELSILQYARIIMKEFNVNLEIKYINKKLVGTPRKILDCSIAKKMGWKPSISIFNGIKKTVRKVENATIPLLCPKCSKPMKHQLDKQMYGIHQMCLHCVTDMESWLKMNGEYEEYERNMIRKNAQYFVDNVTNGLDQFLDDIINESYVTEDGTIQNWVGNGIDKIEVKKQIMEKLQKLKAATEK
jgi:hypothetical protein